MNRKLVSLCSLTVLLTFVISIALEVHVVKASGTIYIRSDGSIEPSDAPLSTNDNVTYSLVSNVTSNADGIVIERDNIRLHGVSYILQGTGAQNYYIGIDLAGRKNVAIEKIEIKAFSIGIRLDSCSNNIISGNIVTKHNYDGIRLLRGSNNNVVFRNILTDNNPNIRLDFSSNYNTIYGNQIRNSDCGVSLYHSSKNNSIFENEITNNTIGISLSESSNNSIYHNNFINNSNQAYSYNSINKWDYGYPSGGNYWSGYIETDSNNDGIGQEEYVIDAGNTDHYPLLGMFHRFITSIGNDVNVVSNSTVEDFQYFESNNTVRMIVSNMTANQTFGFIKICISHSLMSEIYPVTTDGGEPNYVNYNLYDNGTHRWIYFNYEHSKLEIIIIPEFPSFLILPLLMATLLAIAVWRRKYITKS